MGVAPKVGVGARRVVWTAVGQGECVAVHCRRDVGLWSPVGEVSVPFLMAGAVMMHLKQRGTKASLVLTPFKGLVCPQPFSSCYSKGSVMVV